MSKFRTIPCLRRAVLALWASLALLFAWGLTSSALVWKLAPFPAWWILAGTAVCVLPAVGTTVYILARVLPLVRHARARGGMVCRTCAYDLPDEGSGVCPECGRPFTREENRRLWGVHPAGGPEP